MATLSVDNDEQNLGDLHALGILHVYLENPFLNVVDFWKFTHRIYMYGMETQKGMGHYNSIK